MARRVVVVLGSSSSWRRNIMMGQVLPAVLSDTDAVSSQLSLFSEILTVMPDIDEKAVEERNFSDGNEPGTFDAIQSKARLITTAVAKAKMTAVLDKLQRDENGIVTNFLDQHEKQWIESETSTIPQEQQQQQQQALSRASMDDDQLLPELLILTSDQVVIGPVENTCAHEPEATLAPQILYEVREKPADQEQARQFIRSYSGHTATTYAAVVLNHIFLRRKQQEADANLSYELTALGSSVDFQTTTTHFTSFSEDVIESIIGRGTALTTCGAFVVEDPGYASAKTHIEGGGIDAVQGLDAARTAQQICDVVLRRTGKR